MRSLTVSRAIGYGGLVVGVLDIMDAFIFFGLRGATPARILQAIAAGVLGRERAVAGGWQTAALGLLLHFFIATVIVAIFVFASRRWPWLLRAPVATGLAYGVVAWLVMNFIVVPLSAAGGPNLRLPIVINGVLIHMFGVGLPAALFARAAAPELTVS